MHEHVKGACDLFRSRRAVVFARVAQGLEDGPAILVEVEAARFEVVSAVDGIAHMADDEEFAAALHDRVVAERDVVAHVGDVVVARKLIASPRIDHILTSNILIRPVRVLAACDAHRIIRLKIAVGGHHIIVVRIVVIEDERTFNDFAIMRPQELAETVFDGQAVFIEFLDVDAAEEGAVDHPQRTVLIFEEFGVDAVGLGRGAARHALDNDGVVGIGAHDVVGLHPADGGRIGAEAARQRIVHVVFIADLVHVGRPSGRSVSRRIDKLHRRL